MSEYIGRGNSSMQDEYIDFINYVFAYYHRPHDFYTLLPKLYKPEYDPCAESYFVVDDGKIKAAVGAFDSQYMICGEPVKVRGIGNVAVHPYSQRKGYMIRLMNMIVDDMIKEGVDISALGGRRQRYGFFGYEQACAHYGMRCDRDNFRYVYGSRMKDKPVKLSLRAEEVGPDDTYRLDFINAMNDAEPMHAIRDRSRLYDILRSWTNRPYVLIDASGRLRGYVVGGIGEMILDDDSLAPDAVWAMLEATGDYSEGIYMPLTKAAQRAALEPIANGVSLDNGEMILVLHWKKVIGAALRLEATYKTLADGSLTALIHGRAGDEKLRISVTGGVPTVEEYDGEADIELNMLRAVSFFFGVYSSDREKLSNPAAQSWLPLPLVMYGTDGV